MSVRRAQDERIEGTPDGNSAITAIMDVPDAPTIGAVSDPGTDGYASVAFTAATTGGTATSFTATSSPGSISASSATSPITVTGLTIGQAYTFTVTGSNSTGTGSSSAASASFTPTAHTSFESIATVTGTGSSATITFSSIPSTYKHLQIRGIVGRNVTSDFQYYIGYNGDTGNNYAYHTLYGWPSTISSGGSVSQGPTIIGRGSTATNTLSPVIIDIIDYASTTKTKVARSISGWQTNTDGTIALTSNLWNSTAAITSITLSISGYNWSTTTEFALYGIKG